MVSLYQYVHSLRKSYSSEVWSKGYLHCPIWLFGCSDNLYYLDHLSSSIYTLSTLAIYNAYTSGLFCSCPGYLACQSDCIDLCGCLNCLFDCLGNLPSCLKCLYDCQTCPAGSLVVQIIWSSTQYVANLYSHRLLLRSKAAFTIGTRRAVGPATKFAAKKTKYFTKKM